MKKKCSIENQTKNNLTCVSKRQRPETQIGRSVRNTAQDILDGVNSLMDKHLSHVFFFLLVAASLIALLIDLRHTTLDIPILRAMIVQL